MGYKGAAEVGRTLRIAGTSVSQCIERGKILVNTEPEMYQKLINYQRPRHAPYGTGKVNPSVNCKTKGCPKSSLNTVR
jgi:hypothetical protein